MKKLKLKLEGIKEMLTKEQMQKITGGYGDPRCNYSCLGTGSFSDVCTSLCGQYWSCGADAGLPGYCEHVN